VVRVPDAAAEAVRDLVRAREDAVRECRNARHRLKALLLGKGIPYAGRSFWPGANLRWLTTLKMPHATQQIGFQEYLHSVTESTQRIARLEQALRDALPEWRLMPLVQTLQAMRGVQLIAAMTLVVELQDFLRFASPRKPMAYVSLVPGGHSSGAKRRGSPPCRPRTRFTSRVWGKLECIDGARLGGFLRTLLVACDSEHGLRIGACNSQQRCERHR